MPDESSKPPITTKKLSAKHLAFIIEYMTCWNATEAYARVYPKATRETARRNGSDLLSKTDVWGEIQLRLTLRAMGPEEVLRAAI